MEDKIKSGEALAEDLKRVRADINNVAGSNKVRSVTTDRAKANKVMWDIVERDTGMKGAPDAVHVHHSLIGD
eukprot:1751983-Karenia_brevis.AAC.1